MPLEIYHRSPGVQCGKTMAAIVSALTRLRNMGVPDSARIYFHDDGMVSAEWYTQAEK